MMVVVAVADVAPGLRVPCALEGATLPGGFRIKRTTMRGVESQGMLCSAKELGIDADASGLMELPGDAPVGKPLAEYLRLPDMAIEVELTPNRGDCLGMLGLADEVAAELGARAKAFEQIDTHHFPKVRSFDLDGGTVEPRFDRRCAGG